MCFVGTSPPRISDPLLQVLFKYFPRDGLGWAGKWGWGRRGRGEGEIEGSSKLRRERVRERKREREHMLEDLEGRQALLSCPQRGVH